MRYIRDLLSHDEVPLMSKVVPSLEPTSTIYKYADADDINRDGLVRLGGKTANNANQLNIFLFRLFGLFIFVQCIFL